MLYGTLNRVLKGDGVLFEDTNGQVSINKALAAELVKIQRVIRKCLAAEVNGDGRPVHSLRIRGWDPSVQLPAHHHNYLPSLKRVHTLCAHTLCNTVWRMADCVLTFPERGIFVGPPGLVYPYPHLRPSAITTMFYAIF